jgi:hypothetical protein
VLKEGEQLDVAVALIGIATAAIERYWVNGFADIKNEAEELAVTSESRI